MIDSSNSRVRDLLTRLGEYAHSLRWHDVGGGYRWRVEPAPAVVGAPCHAVVIGPGDGQLYRKAHYGFESAERDAIAQAHALKAAYESDY